MTPAPRKGETARAVRVGTQGWNYAAWVGPFYPQGTRPADFLAVYARAFDTVEVDSTFYAIPPAKTFRSWRDRVAHRQGFTFALKLPQEITHERRFRGNSREVLAGFLEGARELGPALGPVLIQLGPDFGPDELPALAKFLPLLPEDMRFAVEFRQRGWIHDGVLATLREHNVALALSDGRWIPRRQVLALADTPTAGFLYVRLMGPNRDVVDYSRIQVDRTRELEQWGGTLRSRGASGLEAFVYVNNHFAGHSPASARDLQRQLGQQAVEPEQLGEQLTFL